MQLLPANITELGEDLLASEAKRNLEKANQMLSDATFGKTMSAMNKLASNYGNLNANVNNIPKTSLSVQLNQKAVAEEIEKSLGSTSNSMYSRMDIIALREKLSQQGINGERLNRLTPLIDSGKSFSLKDIHTALNGGEVGELDMSTAVDLTEAELEQLEAFLGKLGFDSTTVSKLIDDITGGNEVEAWQAIENKLATMPEYNLINVGPDDINALARAFNLSTEQRNLLQKTFSENTDVRPALLLKGLNILNAEIQDRISSDRLLANGSALTGAAGGVVNTSKNKEENIEQADNKQSKAAQRMSARINDTVTSKGDTLPQAAANDNANDANPKTTQQTIAAQGKHLSDDSDSGSNNRESGKNNQNANDFAPKQQTKAENSTSRESADSFLNRVISGDPSLLASEYKAGETASRSQATAFSNQVFSQVETGILRNLQDGVKQLTLQLDPGDLGTLTLVLSVKEKEVSAVIRADNPETAKLIEDQLHKIRQSLENQGLKVENLEVQTNVAGRDAKQQWEGFSEHNSQQENREYRERARLLERLRQVDDPMAHNLQNTIESTAHAANISSSELYIVA